MSISADNGYLIVVDENRRVHTAKTGTLSSSCELTWQKDWVPGNCLGAVFPCFRRSRLFALERPRAFALSHKEADSHLALYTLNSNGTRIFLADSRIKNGFRNEITGPEEGTFAAESLAASGSTLFLFKRERDELGNIKHKMYTRFVDINGLCVPPEDWREQPPIPIIPGVRLTKNIAVCSQNRELRVEGTDRNGREGYYTKKLEDKYWSFHRTGRRIPEIDFHLARQGKKPHKTVHDYRGWVEIEGSKFPAVLRGFIHRGLGERGLHTTIEIEKGPENIISFPLYAGRDLADRHWTMISSATSQKVALVEKLSYISLEGKGIKAKFYRTSPSLKQQKTLHASIKAVYSIALFVLQLKQTLIYLITDLYLEFRYGKEKVKSARSLLQHAHDLDDHDNTRNLILRLFKENPLLAPKAVVDFLCDPQMETNLHEILRGANVLIEDRGQLLEKLRNIKGVKRRHSSHPHQKGKSWGMQMPLFGELLFWIDKEGNLRLQFEKHSLTCFLEFLGHTIDYLKYRLELTQQGPCGSSPYTDAHPLLITPSDSFS